MSEINTQKKIFPNTSFDAHSTKRISYIVITKNRAAILDDFLTRARELVGPQDELIVVDGASEDGTKKVVQKYADIVDIFISEKDRCANEACNKGILLSSGKYIKLLLDDDIYYRDAMEKAAEVMEQHPEVDMLVCGGTKEIYGTDTAAYLSGENTAKAGKIVTSYLPPGVNYGKDITDVFRYRAASSFGHFVRRKSHALGGLMSTWEGDMEYVLAFIKNGANVKFCRVKMYHHIQSPMSPEAYERWHKKSRNLIYTVMKRSVPRMWYYKFRINKFLKEHPFLYWPAKLYWKCAGVLLRMKKGVEKTSSFKVKEKEYIWDGGFS
ncbi:MAG: glycosyltransferase family 2 protein [Candidatus Sungbacteria bacterium]|nr:glycosyltransferase family 2 protein [Candidatus Sungbacteria bacterium]